MESEHVVLALSALAQTSRLAIFRVLVRAGPEGLAAGKIGEATSMAPTSLTFHLKELVHAGLVASRSQGRFMIYTTNFALMNALMAFPTENCCQSMPCGVICEPACSLKEPTS